MRQGGTAMRKGLFVAAGLVLLAGCEVQGPDFLTGEGGLLGPATIVQGETVPVTSIRTATIERSFRGVIVRVEAVAPTQGFHDAVLVARDGGAADAAGIVTLELIARAPLEPAAVGQERTRLLVTGLFVPNDQLRNLRGFRVVTGQGAVTLPLPPASAAG
jgi:hypothetical protein